MPGPGGNGRPAPLATVAELRGGAPTFMGIPHDDGNSRTGVVLLGIPYDNRGDPGGADQGPGAIRRHAHEVRRHFIDRPGDTLTALGARDAGDAAVGGRLADTEAAIEAAVAGLLARGAIPVTMGGDGSTTLPQLRAVGARFPDLCVLHVDAHTDAYPETDEESLASSTSFSRALAEGVIHAEDTFHVGLHGTTRRPGLLEFAHHLGFPALTVDELAGEGMDRFVDELRAHVGDRPVYLCWDMDVVDPSAAPGVLAPVWGGLSAREAIGLIRRLSGMRIVHCDVNGTCTKRDPHGLTATLAAHLILECCAVVLADRGRPGRPPG